MTPVTWFDVIEEVDLVKDAYQPVHPSWTSYWYWRVGETIAWVGHREPADARKAGAEWLAQDRNRRAGVS